jgi:predicted tellurium resistance membrane protein TerC
MALGMSNRAGIVAARNIVALLVVNLMYGAIGNAVNYNTTIAS